MAHEMMSGMAHTAPGFRDGIRPHKLVSHFPDGRQALAREQIETTSAC